MTTTTTPVASVDVVPSYVNENRRVIRSAVLFSSFPGDVIEKTCAELLTRYGIKVEEVLDVARQRGLKDAMKRNDLVLLHHEMGSHKDTGRIKDAGKIVGKNVIPLSRKTSAWEEQLKFTQVPQPKPAPLRVIPDENLESFLREYVDMRNKGVTTDNMLDTLSKYRVSGKFEHSQALSITITKLKERAPAWFREWKSSFVEPTAAVPTSPPATTTAVPEATGTMPAPEVPVTVPEVKLDEEVKETKPEHVQDLAIHQLSQERDGAAELARLYQNEADQLRAKVAELEDKNKHLEAGGKAWASKIAEHVRALVEADVITREDGFEMLMAATVSKKVV